jgi:hypothetical protein
MIVVSLDQHGVDVKHFITKMKGHAARNNKYECNYTGPYLGFWSWGEGWQGQNTTFWPKSTWKNMFSKINFQKDSKCLFLPPI